MFAAREDRRRRRHTDLVSPSSLTHALGDIVHVDFGMGDTSGRRADVGRPRVCEGRRTGHKWHNMRRATVRGEEDSVESHHLVHGNYRREQKEKRLKYEVEE